MIGFFGLSKSLKVTFVMTISSASFELKLFMTPATTLSSLKTSSAFKMKITSPFAILIPLFIASYIPSHFQIEKLFYYYYTHEQYQTSDQSNFINYNMFNA